MPGLVKVGKTTKLPSSRAEELSGVTGVATPFIVVYEELFDDCDFVESFVHTKLAESGMRVSESREFFRAPVSDVIKAILSAVPAIQPTKPGIVRADDLIAPDDVSLAGFQLDNYSAPHPRSGSRGRAHDHRSARLVSPAFERNRGAAITLENRRSGLWDSLAGH